MLKKYHPDPSHVLQSENIEINEALTYEEKPVKLLDHNMKELRNKRIPPVKVLWRNHGIEETTWEVEEAILAGGLAVGGGKCLCQELSNMVWG